MNSTSTSSGSHLTLPSSKAEEMINQMLKKTLHPNIISSSKTVAPLPSSLPSTSISKKSPIVQEISHDLKNLSLTSKPSIPTSLVSKKEIIKKTSIKDNPTKKKEEKVILDKVVQKKDTKKEINELNNS